MFVGRTVYAVGRVISFFSFLWAPRGPSVVARIVTVGIIIHCWRAFAESCSCHSDSFLILFLIHLPFCAVMQHPSRINAENVRSSGCTRVNSSSQVVKTATRKIMRPSGL